MKASVGHVVDLPKSKLGVDVKKDFAPDFTRHPDEEKGHRRSQESGQRQGTYLSRRPTRTAKAKRSPGISPTRSPRTTRRVHRVLINEITKKAVQEAIANPLELDRNKFDAQVARRVLDRLVGYQISPLFWKKVRRGLSAGRVQSVAVRLVCERENEIRAFESIEYWSLTALLEGRLPPSFKAKLVAVARAEGRQ